MSGGIGGGEAGVPDDLLTTKGDTHGYSTENARVPIGANTTVLTADSTQALGLGWAAPVSSITTPAQFVNETWEVLERHVTTATNSHTFTPSTPLTWSEYEKFALTYKFQSAGGGTLQFDFNTAKTGAWRYQGNSINQSPAETLFAGISQGVMKIGVIGANGEQVNGHVIITNSAVTDWASVEAVCNQQNISHWVQGMNVGTDFAENFTDIVISSSGTGWNAACEIVVLGMLKKDVP